MATTVLNPSVHPSAIAPPMTTLPKKKRAERAETTAATKIKESDSKKPVPTRPTTTVVLMVPMKTIINQYSKVVAVRQVRRIMKRILNTTTAMMKSDVVAAKPKEENLAKRQAALWGQPALKNSEASHRFVV